MKKGGLISRLTAAAAAAMLAVCAVGCSGGDDANKKYTLQYSDGSGVHQITVEHGAPYRMEQVPEKTRYDFLGLFDAEEGGKQYVDGHGASLTVFNGKFNLVLFPQYRAKEYTVVLDYANAAASGARQYMVKYGESLPALPTDVPNGRYEFTGWYTQPNGGGTLVSDIYGLIPVVSVLNGDNFDLAQSTVNIYAGFKMKMLTVTLDFGDDAKSEVISVAYGTNVDQLRYATRVNGQAVLAWKNKNGNPVGGDITESVTLYAGEYAPMIELNSNGGEAVNNIIANADTAVALPTPQNEVATFMYWQDENGDEYTTTVMPAQSVKLTAVWKAKIVFDENGGTPVNDISLPSGQDIALPTPEKDGYVFAGWYTADKTRYTAQKMSAVGVKLKAGWYKEKTETIIHITGSEDYWVYRKSKTLFSRMTLDLSKFLSENFSGLVTVKANLKMKNDRASLSKTVYGELFFYREAVISDLNLLYSQRFAINSDFYTDFSYNMTFELVGNKIYCAVSNSEGTDASVANTYQRLYISDYYYDVTYPDTTQLFL